MRTILNLPLIILFIIGMVICLFNLKEKLQKPLRIQFVTLYFLIIPSFWGFVLAQSFLWWQGMMRVLATTRFITSVLPLSAVIALTGFEWIMKNIKSHKFIHFAVGSLIIAWVIYTPSRYKQLPIKTGKNFAVMQQLTTWLKTTPYSNRKVAYSDPMFPFYMNLDPFDNQKCFRIYSYDHIDPSDQLKPREILIWDAQFSGFEGHLPFNLILKNANLQLINTFAPAQSFNIIGKEKYKLAVFIKKTDKPFTEMEVL